MSLRYLLDTDILSEAMRPQPDAPLVQRLRDHGAESALAAPVWHELVFGARRLPPSRRRRAIEQFLFEVLQPQLPVLPYDGPCAAWHAGERARLVAAGRTPSFVDGQIAAIAVMNDLILVTRNRPDFDDFAGLTLEAWDSG
jgi:tRNA(fMet)-specific endonuclease VapC